MLRMVLFCVMRVYAAVTSRRHGSGFPKRCSGPRDPVTFAVLPSSLTRSDG